jgi:hypothetical protein
MWVGKRRDREINHIEGTEGQGITIFFESLNIIIFSVPSVVIF